MRNSSRIILEMIVNANVKTEALMPWCQREQSLIYAYNCMLHAKWPGMKPRYYGLTPQLYRTSLHTGHVIWGYLWNNFQKCAEESSKSIFCQPWMEPTVAGHHGLCCGIIRLDPEPTRGPVGVGISNLLIAGPGSYSCATAQGPVKRPLLYCVYDNNLY